MEEQVKEILEKEIKPALAADGGSIEFVGLEGDGVVKVKLQGACVGCSGGDRSRQLSPMPDRQLMT